MAVVHATSIGKARGSIGMNTYTVIGGETIAKEKVFNPRIPRTYKQMQTRVRWANLVNLWRTFSDTLHPSFEGKRPRVSDFNEFIAKNIKGTPVYLTSTEASLGATVIAAYDLTSGTLPSISVTVGTGDVPVSNISLGNLVIDGDTTLKQFSLAVVNNNPKFRNGDQISCFIGTQEQNSVTGIPFVEMQAYEVTLNVMDEETLLSDLVPANGFSTVDAKLGASGAVVGGIAWVHSRIENGEVKVSPQSFHVNNALLSQYQTSAKRQEAIVSYKGNLSVPFLTPDVDTPAAPVAP